MKIKLLMRLLCAAILILPAGVMALDCSREPGSVPNPVLPPGISIGAIPLNHIVVIMQENHSFDNYFGALSSPQYYGDEVDGIKPGLWNPDAAGRRISVFHETSLCLRDPRHDWNAMHADWNGGKNDQFVIVNHGDASVMGYFDQGDIPFYYALADEFAIADRYFSSALTQTYPNRYFLFAATAFGQIRNESPGTPDQWSQKTIFDVLDDHGISWKYYTNDRGYLQLFQPLWRRSQERMGGIADFARDLAAPGLPSVIFIDAAFDGEEDEHPDANIQVGQAWVAARVRELMGSRYWADSALFLSYDEGGGFFDHVPPSEACVPDGIAPILRPDSLPGAYDRYGFRVPFIAVSPWAKRHYVSHRVYDHTSVLKFIETKFNLPALTRRDANADDLTDLFDFSRPNPVLPELPAAIVDPARRCGS